MSGNNIPDVDVDIYADAALLNPYEEAEQLVEGLVRRQRFDAATELSRYLPATVVYDLIGLPEVSVDDMLEWTKGGFNSLGPAQILRASRSLPSLRP